MHSFRQLVVKKAGNFRQTVGWQHNDLCDIKSTAPTLDSLLCWFVSEVARAKMRRQKNPTGLWKEKEQRGRALMLIKHERYDKRVWTPPPHKFVLKEGEMEGTVHKLYFN